MKGLSFKLLIGTLFISTTFPALPRPAAIAMASGSRPRRLRELVFYVAREHYSHISQALPYLILLLCPLMHLFGHNHGGHSHASGATVSKGENRK